MLKIGVYGRKLRGFLFKSGNFLQPQKAQKATKKMEGGAMKHSYEKAKTLKSQ